ncbi:elongator complex protein 4 [Tachysurus vachellii]|uniref:elongator complex protein 4 n=1 Tax=Tachysurus vachellii TaxID=175792 RepID=UPI00296A9E5D|nr:elongator complex protein 4 [Tachysurus vachellii]
MAAHMDSATKGSLLSRTSFQKKSRSKLLQIPGTKPSVHTGQLIVSSGVPSLDCALGGGLAVGSLLLIEEDEFDSYSRTLLQYFLAEGVMSGHELFIASAQDHPDDIIKDLPSPLQDGDPGPKTVSSSNLDQQDAMKIAWRYQNLPKVQTALSSSSRFGHYYDLSKHMEQDLLQNTKIHTFYLPEEQTDAKHQSLNPSGVLGPYSVLLRSIQLLIRQNGFDGSNSQVKPCNVLRLALHSLGSALWGDDVCVSPANNHALLSFLYALRALLRSSLSVATVTVPTHLVRNKLIRGRMIRLSDTAIALQSFSDAERNNSPLYKDYHGLLHVIQVPRLNCLSCEVPDTKDLAFRLKRKQFTIERMHLPPDLSDSVSRVSKVQHAPVCTTDRNKHLDF